MQLLRDGLREALRRLASRGAERRARLRDGRLGRRHAFRQFADASVAPFQVRETRRARVAQLEERGDGRAVVLALEALDERETVVERLKRLGVRVEAAHGVLHAARELLHAHGDGLQFLAPLLRGLVVLRHLGEAHAGRREGVGGGGVVAGERGRGGVRAVEDLGRVRRRRVAGGQLRLVLLAEVGRVKLVHRVAEALAFLGEVARVALERVKLGAEVAEVAPGRRIGGEVDLAIGVEEAALERLFEKRLVVVRAVDVHEEAPERAQGLHGRGRVVHVDASAACGGHGAPHDEGAVLAGRQPGILKDARHLDAHRLVPKRELGLHARLLRAVAHRGGVRPRAEHELERAHEHALARAGFAGDDVQSLAERDVSRFDDGEVVDCEAC